MSTFAAIACAALLSGHAAIPNPVVPGTADCGVLRFGGEYYLMGVGTNGAVHISPDLVSWSAPKHVFSMQNQWATGPAGADCEIHACDLKLSRGRFHLFWSVNYQEKLRAIGHAVSDSPTGPYSEATLDKPFDFFIDPHVFTDENGSQYFYTVKFTDGNVVWGQPMANPGELTGQASPLLSAVRGAWDFQDHKVNEAPWMAKHNGLYYLLYNGNHTGSHYGHYAIGAAVAESPLGFTNERKYPFPVLGDNRDSILARGRQLAPVAGRWRYVQSEPVGDWTSPQYDDAGWIQGEAGFGGGREKTARDPVRTEWSGGALWMRQDFESSELPSQHVQLLINAMARVSVFLNGIELLEGPQNRCGYAAVDLPESVRQAFRVGRNILAIKAESKAKRRYLDAALFDPVNHPGEAIVTNCGQPNVVRGPNGWEWWMVYFAIYDGDFKRSQAVDRVFFFGKELHVDGPTSARTPGYHPVPSLPTFGDRFDREALPPRWKTLSGDWKITEGCLTHSGEEAAELYPDTPPSSQYVCELALRAEDESANVGLTLWRKDSRNFIRFMLDRAQRQAYCRRVLDGIESVVPISVPDDFGWDGWHSIRVENNEGVLSLWIDDTAPLSIPSIVGLADPGTPGPYARGDARFDGFIYTRGWEDRNAARLIGASGREETVLLGESLTQYEFAAQCLPSDVRSCGVYGVYVNDRNWLRADFTPALDHVVLSIMRDGVVHVRPPLTVASSGRRVYPVEEAGRNIRFVRRDDTTIIFVDGQEIARCDGTWPAARVGLRADGGIARFAHTLRFELAGTDQ